MEERLTTSVFESIQNIAADLFDTRADSITAASSPENIEAWDSIQHLNLVLALEEKFELQLSPEEIEKMRTIGDVTKLVESKLQATPR
jgi:acyl carrier protein